MTAAPGWIVLHAGALGDLALTLHLARTLASVRRCDGLTLISRIDCGQLAEFRPRVTRICLEGIGAHWLYIDEAVQGPPPEPLARALHGRNVLSGLGPASGSVHRSLLRLGAARVLSIDPPAQPGASTHICTQWQRQAQAAGELIDACVYQARSAAAGSRAKSFLIHPGSGGAAKCWPLSAFIDLARVIGSADRAATFAIGPAEQERWSTEALAALRREFSTSICDSTDEWLALARQADLVIGNDSGPMHLAALIGRPTLSLFGPTRASVWRPIGPFVDAIQGDPALGPSWGISVDQVLRRATPPPSAVIH